MPIRSTFATVADQLAAYNKNILDTLEKINSLITSQQPSVELELIDTEGQTVNYSVPSFSFLKSEIDRLNNSISSLYNLDATGTALIQTSNANIYKKIMTVDLNREPASIADLGPITRFRAKKNWFFDSMLNPMMFIEINLDGKIENNVRKILSRRYIVDFTKDANGNFTTQGQQAANDFNTLYRNKTNIDIVSFENWLATTPGIATPLNPNYDEDIFDLEPNVLLYNGLFNVLDIQEDTVNGKLWFTINTLTYFVNDTGAQRQLALDDQLIINQGISNTRYKIIEISNSESSPRIRLERIEGVQPVPTGIGVLKYYSPVVYLKKVRISIGYNERNVIFIKPMNADSNLLAKDWSFGTGYYTNDLSLVSNGNDNGSTMNQFYTDIVYDYGAVLEDLVAKKIPTKLSGFPNTVVLNPANFKVVLINTHLSESSNANKIKQLYSQMLANKSQIEQLQKAIEDLNKERKVKNFASKKEQEEFDKLILKKIDEKSSLTNQQNKITEQLKGLQSQKVEDPKYRVRGFWKIPDPVITPGTRPQEIIRFRIHYRYLSKSGDTSTNWTELMSDTRKRNTTTGLWEVVDNSEFAKTPQINQIEVSITANERVEIKVQSISEVGWPDSPLESAFSEPIIIEFPDNLLDVLNDDQFALEEAKQEDLKFKVFNELSSRGLDEHLSETTNINNKLFHHSSDKIISGFKDANGVILDLFEYLTSLEARVKSLEEKVKQVKGELQIQLVWGQNIYNIENGKEVNITIELERLLTSKNTTKKLYDNKIYKIEDYSLIIRNISSDSPLGLSSNRLYQKSEIYADNAPQVFWVDKDDNLLKSDATTLGSRTQLSNQWIWALNYLSVTTTSVTKISENIGNNFISVTNNSITEQLALPDLNLGYSTNAKLFFKNENNSLMEPEKWIDRVPSNLSSSRLLTTIHPKIEDLQLLVENNDSKIKSIAGGGTFKIPVVIYFKLTATSDAEITVDSSSKQQIHTKYVKFYLQDVNASKPFIFSIKFTLKKLKEVVGSVGGNFLGGGNVGTAFTGNPGGLIAGGG